MSTNGSPTHIQFGRLFHKLQRLVFCDVSYNNQIGWYRSGMQMGTDQRQNKRDIGNKHFSLPYWRGGSGLRLNDGFDVKLVEA